MKSCRDGGSDIHDVSGNGNRNAASTVSQPRFNGMELTVPLRVVQANDPRFSDSRATASVVRTSCDTSSITVSNVPAHVPLASGFDASADRRHWRLKATASGTRHLPVHDLGLSVSPSRLASTRSIR